MGNCGGISDERGGNAFKKRQNTSVTSGVFKSQLCVVPSAKKYFCSVVVHILLREGYFLFQSLSVVFVICDHIDTVSECENT